MSAAATADARLGVDVREAARVEADSVAGFVNRPPKRRRSELVAAGCHNRKGQWRVIRGGKKD